MTENSATIFTSSALDKYAVVNPKRAREILDVGNTKLYELLHSGELRSYKQGTSRKITVASIIEYQARRLAESAQPRDR